MLIRLHFDVKPERIVVVFDAPGRTFRDDLDADYKKTRSETPEDLLVQMPYFRPLTEVFSWPVIAVPGVEADDVIATLTKRARAQDWDVIIYTGDKDMMQLVDENVTCIDSMRHKNYDIAGVHRKVWRSAEPRRRLVGACRRQDRQRSRHARRRQGDSDEASQSVRLDRWHLRTRRRDQGQDGRAVSRS